MRILSIIGLMATIAFVSCRSSVPITQAAEQKDPIEGMVFLTFVMRDDSVSGKGIILTGKTFVSQKLKSDPIDSTSPNRLLISQKDSSGKKLSLTALDHPLLRRVEFPDDKGQFQSKDIKLKDAEFFARVTLYRETEYIEVEEELRGKITYTAKFSIRK